MSIINEDRLREFVVHEVRQMPQETVRGLRWRCIVAYFGIVIGILGFDHSLRTRLSRLETIVATEKAKEISKESVK